MPDLERITFGVNTDLGSIHPLYPSAKRSHQERVAYMDMVSESGAKWIRDVAMISWLTMQENKDDEVDVSLPVEIATLAGERGLEVLAVVTHGPLWAITKGDHDRGKYINPVKREYEAEFRHFVRKTVKALTNLEHPVTHYEYLCEADEAWYVEPNEYAFWLKAFYEEAKGVNPDAKVSIAGLTSPGIIITWVPREKDHVWRWMESVLDSPELKGPDYPYFDIMNIHNYPVNYSYRQLLESIDVMNHYVRRAMSIRNMPLPVWLTETGDAHNLDHSSLQKQAEDIVKDLVHAQSVGIDKVFQFDFNDFSYTKEQRLCFGMITDNAFGEIPQKKPSFHAFKVLNEKLCGAVQLKRIGISTYRAYKNENKEDPIYIIWKDGDEVNLPAEIQGKYKVTDIRGKERVQHIDSINFTREPIFLEKHE